jgi:7-keto-8-aminopelargonate synthetase-like enzyme
MHPRLEALMARGRAAGITQRTARAIGGDGRTLVLEPTGQEVVSFATCSYLGLDRDPRLAEGAIAAIRAHGVALSASRCFVTSPLYAEADAALAEVFGRPVVLAGSTTLAHGAALPILVERHDVVLFDRQVHHSVQTALAALGSRGPRCVALPHADLDALELAVRDALAGGARRVWYAADGIYSMFGDRLDVAGLAALMARYPALYAYLDDAHGMSWCGRRGAGSLFDAGLPIDRTIIATSLAKGFGATGGVLVATKERIENLGPSLMFSIQLPPAVLGAIVASARLHLTDELPAMQAALAAVVDHARARFADDPAIGPRLQRVVGAPTPVLYVTLGAADTVVGAAADLLASGYLVNPVAFPAVPMDAGGLRVTLTRAHTRADVDGLVAAIGEAIAAAAPARKAG